MQYKIIFVAMLIIIFICELLGFRYFLLDCHKGRIGDSVVAAFIIVICLAMIVLFSKVYDHFFHIFKHTGDGFA